MDKSFVDGVSERRRGIGAHGRDHRAGGHPAPAARSPEGIERADQLEKLLALRCDLGQGFYFAKPLPLDAVDELLTNRQTLETRETELSS